MSLEKLIDWWQRSLFVALLLSIAMIGVGGIKFASSEAGISAWSISRTTFVFWIILKLLFLIRHGWPPPNLSFWRQFAPLYAFFAVVTLSLFPDFRGAGDYRYFVFACAHALMVADLFTDPHRQRWLPVLMGVLPIVSVARGIVHDPSVLSLDLAHRFGFPLDHANTAGYLLSMSIPVCLIVALTQPGLWRAVAWVSWAAQMAALMLTYSRGAWLGWCASMFILVVLTKRWKTLVVMIAIVMTCMVTLPALRQRVTTVIQPRSDQALSERLEMMTDAFRVGIQNPLLGAGYDRGRVKAALRSNYQDTAEAKVPMSHTHNVYLELFAAIGLLGLGIFLWLIMDAFHRLLGNEFAPSESERTIRFLIVASWTAAIVTGLGDVPFYHHETRVFFFTLLAWIHLYVRKARSGAQVHHWA